MEHEIRARLSQRTAHRIGIADIDLKMSHR
jgi:hypothetical protein